MGSNHLGRFVALRRVSFVALTTFCAGRKMLRPRAKRSTLRAKARDAMEGESVFARIAEIYSKAGMASKAARWYQQMASFGLKPTLGQVRQTGPDPADRPVERSQQTGKHAQHAIFQAGVRGIKDWMYAVPSERALKQLRTWRRDSMVSFSGRAVMSSQMESKILELCDQKEPHLAELQLQPMLQAIQSDAALPLSTAEAAARIISCYVEEGSWPGLFRAEIFMEWLISFRQHEESVRAVIVGAGERLLEAFLAKGCTLHAELLLVQLLHVGYHGLRDLRGQICEQLSETDVLKAESWMVAWMHEHVTAATVPKPQSKHIAALCRGFTRNPLTYFKASIWIELALESQIRLNVTDFEPILECMFRTKRLKERPYILRSLVCTCFDHDHISLAEKLVDLSIAHGLDTQQTLSVFIAEKAQHGRIDAVPWIGKMLDRRLVPDAQTFVVGIRAERDLAVASELLAIMDANMLETNTFVYSAVIAACAEADAADLALAWFTEAKAADVHPNQPCYNALLNAQARCQQADAAVHWLKDMEGNSIRADVISYNSVISGFAGTGRDAVSKAESVIHEMQAFSVTPSAQTYGSLIHVAARSGDVRSAEAWYVRMVKAGLRVECRTLRMLMDAAATAGDVARAEWWWAAANRMGEPQQIEYNTLMKSYAKARQVRKAEDLFLSMSQRCKPSEVTFGILMEGRASIGDVDGVRFWQERFRETGGELGLVMYNLFFKACGEARPKGCRAAEEMLRSMVDNTVRPNFISLRTLAYVLGKPEAQNLCSSLRLDWNTERPGQGVLSLRSTEQGASPTKLNCEAGLRERETESKVATLLALHFCLSCLALFSAEP